MRTGQLVVRYHSSLRRRILLTAAALGAIVVLYGTYEWGRFEGGYNRFAEVQRRRELTATIEKLERENAKLQAEIAAVELTREVERKAYADVERTLSDLQAQVLKAKEELTFYRGIVSPENGIGGLRIQSLQVLPGGADHHYRLRLVLAQSMREDRVASGAVHVAIEGVRQNRPASLSLADAGGKTRADGSVAFQFRYFQNLEQDIVLPEDFEPHAVNVEVRSSRSPPVRESLPWRLDVEG